jgi:hypothetical protein
MGGGKFRGRQPPRTLKDVCGKVVKIIENLVGR